MMYYLFHMRMD